jgi:hypothetical protein
MLSRYKSTSIHFRLLISNENESFVGNKFEEDRADPASRQGMTTMIMMQALIGGAGPKPTHASSDGEIESPQRKR